jgi:hypothetical protein
MDWSEPLSPHSEERSNLRFVKRRHRLTRTTLTTKRASRAVALSIILAATLALAEPAHAYIGPGAGFALLSSFLVLFTTIILALFSLLILPFRHEEGEAPQLQTAGGQGML